MADIVFIVITVAFFAASMAYVRGCELLVRPPEEATEEGDAE